MATASRMSGMVVRGGMGGSWLGDTGLPLGQAAGTAAGLGQRTVEAAIAASPTVIGVQRRSRRGVILRTKSFIVWAFL
jgi:hypothetical protein